MSTGSRAAGTVLEVTGLKTHFFADEGVVKAVDGVDLTITAGQTLCVVGESGCGKSMTARSILQLIDKPGRIVDGRVLLHRRLGGPEGVSGEETVDIAALDPRGETIREVRGNDVAMIFQEPMTSLSLVHTVGNQIGEAIAVHFDTDKEERRRRSLELLGRVGIPNPARTLEAYPFQLSGGLRQRAMIAMALANNPTLLIADEPTTALDVTTQAQIMDLLRTLQRELGMAIMFITHDMGVVAEMADHVAVMYLGQVVEDGPVDDIFHDPGHPYTRALLDSIPKLGQRVGERRKKRLRPIRGMVPDPSNRPAGCVFHTRCDEFMEGRCDRVVPASVSLGADRQVRCLLYGGAEKEPVDEPHTTSGGQDGR